MTIALYDRIVVYNYDSFQISRSSVYRRLGEFERMWPQLGNRFVSFVISMRVICFVDGMAPRNIPLLAGLVSRVCVLGVNWRLWSDPEVIKINRRTGADMGTGERIKPSKSL